MGKIRKYGFPDMYGAWGRWKHSEDVLVGSQKRPGWHQIPLLWAAGGPLGITMKSLGITMNSLGITMKATWDNCFAIIQLPLVLSA